MIRNCKEKDLEGKSEKDIYNYCKLGYFIKKLTPFDEAVKEIKFTFQEFINPLINTLKKLVEKNYYTYDIKPDNIAFELVNDEYIPRFIDIDGWWEWKEEEPRPSSELKPWTSLFSTRIFHWNTTPECNKKVLINIMLYQIIISYLSFMDNNKQNQPNQLNQQNQQNHLKDSSTLNTKNEEPTITP